MRAAALIPLLLLAGCAARDETVTAYGALGRTYDLIEMDGGPPPAAATLEFPEPGRLAGDGPCNRFSGPVTVPYPWFGTGPLAVTRRGCPELAAEQAILAALAAMDLAEVAGPLLLLTASGSGRSLVFQAAD